MDSLRSVCIIIIPDNYSCDKSWISIDLRKYAGKMQIDMSINGHGEFYLISYVLLDKTGSVTAGASMGSMRSSRPDSPITTR